ncbi:MAG: His/Gly/Thr/Pro-type tRNA ligase C-terminal domain-containing protein, partial [Oscillospiraceae bacterium]
GAFPLWLAPEQVKILPIADRHHDRAFEIKKELEKAGLRTEVDDRAEKIGYKIREAQLQKVPYMLVLGDNEVESGTISVRHRGEGDIGSMEINALVQRLLEEVSSKVHD